ncbi:hypothetical protein [Gracilibacillus suaedae]|uniref:hypothetical protein n=1 Tax=Gracilibacillus suaedae TaxID=2820273 RepID=UPI001ABE89DF|nr:hypothetical protein [Gracilibacillus suaedae]
MALLRLGIVGWNQEVNDYISFINDGLIQNLNVVAIFDKDPSIKRIVHYHYPDIPFYHSYKEMMYNENVEAVLSFHPSLLHSK